MLFLYIVIDSAVNFIIEQNSKTQALGRRHSYKINGIKLEKPFQALLCVKDNNKTMGSFNLYEKSQHCDRLVFAEEMSSR